MISSLRLLSTFLSYVLALKIVGLFESVLENKLVLVLPKIPPVPKLLLTSFPELLPKSPNKGFVGTLLPNDNKVPGLDPIFKLEKSKDSLVSVLLVWGWGWDVVVLLVVFVLG